MSKREYHTTRLSECRELSPKPTGIGEWADKLRQAAFNAVKEADMTELMSGLIERAKKGDNGAAKLVLSYLAGGAPAAPAKVTLPQELTELAEAMTARLERMSAGDLPRLGENRGGPGVGVRESANGFELVGAIGHYATEQEAEAAARRMCNGTNHSED